MSKTVRGMPMLSDLSKQPDIAKPDDPNEVSAADSVVKPNRTDKGY